MRSHTLRLPMLSLCVVMMLLTGCTSAVNLRGIQVKWKAHMGTPPKTWIDAPAAIADGKVFVAAGEPRVGGPLSNEAHYLQALDANDGHFIWHFETNGSGAVQPLVQDGVVYLAAQKSSLFALDTLTGQPKWAYPDTTSIASEIPRFACPNIGDAGRPIVRDGVAYLVCNCNDNEAVRAGRRPGAPGSMLAVDLKSGRLQWEVFVPQPDPWSPAVTERTVSFVDRSSRSLRSLDRATGKELWKYTVELGITSPPIVAADTIYIASYQDLYSLDDWSGDEKWHFHVAGQGTIASLTIDDDTLYAAQNIWNVESRSLGYVFAFAVPTRSEQWRFDAGARVISAPIVDRETLYVVTNDSLYALDKRTGKTKWRFGVHYALHGPAVNDGIVYIGDDHGDLYALWESPSVAR